METNYRRSTKALISKTDWVEDEIFDYSETPHEEEFNNVFKFYSETMKIENKHYNFSPYSLFFRNNVNINAIAGKHNGYYFIGLNSGLIVNLINGIKMSKFEIPNDIIADDFINKLDNSINTILYQYSVHYTFYHELAHLVQFSCKNEKKVTLNSQEVIDNNFSLERHFLEIDADIYSSLCLSSHTLGYAQKILKNPTRDTYTLMTKVCLTAIILYIQSFFNINQAFYLKSKSHPHPVVRIINASLTVITYINKFITSKGFDPIENPFEVIFDSINISCQMPINKFNPNNYQQIANSNRKEILEYIEEIRTMENECSAISRRNLRL